MVAAVVPATLVAKLAWPSTKSADAFWAWGSAFQPRTRLFKLSATNGREPHTATPAALFKLEAESPA
jgi:hypothetical protein